MCCKEVTVLEVFCIYYIKQTDQFNTRENEVEEQIPHMWTSPEENYLTAIIRSVSNCVADWKVLRLDVVL